MSKKLRFESKDRMVQLAGNCFWYWSTFEHFLKSAGVSEELIQRYPRGGFSKYDVMRNVLSDLDRAGDVETIQSIASAFFKLRSGFDADKVDQSRCKKLLEEFRELLGNDPIEWELEARARQEAKSAFLKEANEQATHRQRLEELNQQFGALAVASDVTPQQRGFKLETLFFDLLELNEFEFSRPYRTKQGEQIDGHFKFEKFDYLVETKWENSVTKQPDLSIFDGKIRGKAQSTRGFFLAAAGFDPLAIQKFSGDAPRIVLMTGHDLMLVLAGRFSMHDAINAKVDAIVRHGRILLPLNEL